jgi:uncharacterized protein
VPSRATWTRGSARVSLTQRTSYPYEPATQIELKTDRPESFTMHLRVPAWAGAKTTVAVNGRRIDDPLTPGTFAAITRTWNDGDRIEMEFEMATQLVPADPQHPDIVAPVVGPLALFALGRPASPLRRSELLAVAQTSRGSSTWSAQTAQGNLDFKPFAAIEEEQYRLYHEVEA